MIGVLNYYIALNALGNPTDEESLPDHPDFEAFLVDVFFSIEWEEVYDIINPFIPHGRLGINSVDNHYTEVFVLDLQKGSFSIVTKHSIWEGPYDPASKTVLEPDCLVVKELPFVDDEATLLPGSILWTPKFESDERIYAFTYRLYSDFLKKWSHILNGSYNKTTFHIMANAVLKIAGNSIDVYESTQPRKSRNRDFYPRNLPKWNQIEHTEFFFGTLKVLVCQTIHEGQRLALEQTKSFQLTRLTEKPQYLILTLRHIVLARINSSQVLEFTTPEPFLIGEANDLSVRAVNYILCATEDARQIIKTRLQRLPLEIQNIILAQASDGAVLSAQIGCLLQIGSPFLWRRNGKPVIFQPKDISYKNSNSTQSHLLMAEDHCALIYETF
jgi:hypothetical protein